jgi:predicted enzyme related to lactoylglutathione lyase
MKLFNAITHVHLWVLDHQQALDFYVGKLGMEIKADFSRGGFRWVTVGIPGEANPEIQLDVPGPPVMDEKTSAQIRDLIARGVSGGLVLRTDDCFATFENLRAKGVEVVQPATEHPYGIDCTLRDPFGNQVKILQPKAWQG